jgi:ABC-type uncharacterized transport system substrate-binding protein
MPIQYLPDDQYTIQINEEVAAQLGITIPADLQAK